MVNTDNLNYGAIYSFEPDYMRQVLEDNPEYQHEDKGLSGLDTSEALWAGVLLVLVVTLMVGLGYSLTRSASEASIAKLSGVERNHSI